MADELTQPQLILYAAFADRLEDVTDCGAFRLASEILGLASRALAIDGAALEDVCVSARHAYDDFVAPIDLPTVPDVASDVVNSLCWQALDVAIRVVGQRK